MPGAAWSTSLREDILAAPGGDPGPAVAHAEDSGAALGAQFHLDQGRGSAEGRVQRVVHQVAEDGDEPARIHQPVGDEGGLGQPQGDAPLGGDGRLAHQEGRQQRVVDLLGDLLGRRAVHTDDLGDEVHRLLVQAQLQQAEEGVEPVGVLVVLRAQGVDQAAGGVELPAEVFQLRAVAEGGDGAAVLGGHAVGDQHPGAWTVTRSRPVTRPDSTSAVRPVPRTASSGRPVKVAGASGARPSRRAASSLTRRTRPSGASAITPSRMECSIASRSARRLAMSEKARSRVCRWMRRERR
ncbi:hypothetical protein SF23_04695 [Streptomyces sp. MBRL 10]|nr:hypothetical protein SF23_04695 [Streptomyces sp. MBRL 10]